MTNRNVYCATGRITVTSDNVTCRLAAVSFPQLSGMEGEVDAVSRLFLDTERISSQDVNNSCLVVALRMT